MATVTLATLRTRAKRRADLENSSFISDAEWNDYINEAYGEFYDELIQSFSDYFEKTDTFTTVPGTDTYNLPADFYKLIALDQQQGSRYATLFPYGELERNANLSTASNIPATTIRRRYIPTPTFLAADGDTINTFAGWESVIVTDAAIMALEKEESDTTSLERRRERQYRRVMEMSQNRDVTMPGKVTDVTLYDASYIRDSLRYRIYSTTLQLINTQYIGV